MGKTIVNITDEAVEAAAVTRDDAIAFLECACRNWSRVPKLSDDDIDDVAAELTRFASKRVLSSPAPEVVDPFYAASERVRKVLDERSSQPTPNTAEELEVVAWGMPNRATVYMDGSSPWIARNREFRGSLPLADYAKVLDIIEEQARTIEKLRAEIETTNLSWNQTSGMLGFALKRANLAEARLAEAVEALDQLLDDMGEDGLSVCQAAKDQARTFLQSLGKEGWNEA